MSSRSTQHVRSARGSAQENAGERSLETARAVDCVRRLVNALGESARAVEQHTGITNAQLFLVRQLRSEGVLTINELAARSLTQQSTVSLLVQRLEAAGLVDRSRSASDARRVCVSLTAKGKRLVERAPEPPIGRMLRSLEAMQPVDVDALITGVNALLDTMHVHGDVRPLFEPQALRSAPLRPATSRGDGGAERTRGAPRKRGR